MRVFLSLPLPSSTPLSVLSVRHICGLCGDVSPLRMDSPAQKRPYYIYILLHHSETVPAGLAELGTQKRERGQQKKYKKKEEEKEEAEGLKEGSED